MKGSKPITRLAAIVAALFVVTAANAQTGLVTVGFTGDSITASTFNRFGTNQHLRPNTEFQGHDGSWTTQAMVRTGGNLVYFRNWAQHGFRAQAITDTIINVALTQPTRPDVLVVKMGANDVAQGRPEDVTNVATNFERLLAACRAAGVELVPATIIPNSNTSTSVLEVRQRANAWIRAFAQRERLKLIDLHAAIVSPNGTAEPSLVSDGVHPNEAGHAAMGAAAARVLRHFAGPGQPMLTQSGRASDRLNRFLNGAFAPFNDRPESWNTSFTFTPVPASRLDGVLGLWARHQSNGHTGANWLLSSPRINVTPGNLLLLGYRFRTQGITPGNFGLYVKVDFFSNGTYVGDGWPLFAAKFEDNLDSPEGYVWKRLLHVPANINQVSFSIVTSRMNNPYVLDLAQMTLYDLTNIL